jgi:Xaa-Pro aminopeptidase
MKTNRHLFLLIIGLVQGTFSMGQANVPYSYDKDLLPSGFFVENREHLRTLMPDSSVAVFFSAPVRNRANDVNYVYHQDPDFYYLTGFCDADALLLIFKQPVKTKEGKLINERLIIARRDEKQELWTGRMADTDEAGNISGIKNVVVSDEPDAMSLDWSSFFKVMHKRFPQGVVDDRSDAYDLFDLIKQFKATVNYPSQNDDDFLLAKYTGKLRHYKSTPEINLLQKAVDISIAGHLAMMDSTAPGMTEYQIEAVGEYQFHRLGAEDIGYSSICGSSENSCILHYEKNRRTVNNGDLILLDMGAEYHGYTADITRTLPVNGTFSAPQRQLYELVWSAQQAGFRACLSGNDFKAPHRAALDVIEKGLLELGIIKEKSEARKYFPHGTSHNLGLDVHDTGDNDSLRAGQVITVEPGIYIPEGSPCSPKWWKIGIRIEDDVLITDKEPLIMSAALPSKWEEVEKRMKLAKSTKGGQ